MIINNIEILDTYWVGNFGFVKGLDKITKEITFFAGEGNGLNYEADTQLIIALGNKYNERQFFELVKWFSPNLWEENVMLRKELETQNIDHKNFCEQVKEKVKMLEDSLAERKSKKGNKK